MWRCPEARNWGKIYSGQIFSFVGNISFLLDLKFRQIKIYALWLQQKYIQYLLPKWRNSTGLKHIFSGKFFCFRQNLHCCCRKNVFFKGLLIFLITLIQLLQLWKQKSGIKWKCELILVSINASTSLWFQTHRISPLADFKHQDILQWY